MLLFCKSTRIWALSTAFSITHSFIIQLRYGAAIQHATLCALTCTGVSSTASAVHIQHYTIALHAFYSTCYHNANLPALGHNYITVLLFCTYKCLISHCALHDCIKLPALEYSLCISITHSAFTQLYLHYSVRRLHLH